MLCFSLPSVGFSSLILSHSHSFSFSFSLSHRGGKVPSRGSVAKAGLAPLSRRGSLVSLWKKLWLIINISLTYNARQALEEPAGRGSCHSGVVSDCRPNSGTQWSVMKLLDLFVELLQHPTRISTQSLRLYYVQIWHLPDHKLRKQSWSKREQNVVESHFSFFYSHLNFFKFCSDLSQGNMSSS